MGFAVDTFRTRDPGHGQLVHTTTRGRIPGRASPAHQKSVQRDVSRGDRSRGSTLMAPRPAQATAERERADLLRAADPVDGWKTEALEIVHDGKHDAVAFVLEAHRTVEGDGPGGETVHARRGDHPEPANRAQVLTRKRRVHLDAEPAEQPVLASGVTRDGAPRHGAIETPPGSAGHRCTRFNLSDPAIEVPGRRRPQLCALPRDVQGHAPAEPTCDVQAECPPAEAFVPKAGVHAMLDDRHVRAGDPRRLRSGRADAEDGNERCSALPHGVGPRQRALPAAGVITRTVCARRAAFRWRIWALAAARSARRRAFAAMFSGRLPPRRVKKPMAPAATPTVAMAAAMVCDRPRSLSLATLPSTKAPAAMPRPFSRSLVAVELL